MDDEAILVLGIVSIGAWIWLGAMLIHYRCKFRMHHLDVTLKRDLAERGMSADEIKIVIEAGKNDRFDPRHVHTDANIAAETSPSLKNGKPRMTAHSELA